MRNFVATAVFFMFLLAACQAPDEVSVLPEPTLTVTAVIPEPSPEPIEAIIISPTEPATAVAPPTSTPLPTITPTVTPSPTPSGPQTITADHPHISYIGRFNFTNEAAPTFDWPGVTIEAAFTGPAITLLLEDGNNLYNLYIDGQESLLWTYAGQTEYPIATGLDESVHTVRLVKRTEFDGAVGTFRGFHLPAGGSIQPAPARPSRRIEFIGDSITAGYGVEGDSPTCSYSSLTQNIEQTYAGMLGRALEAEVMTTAISGLGVIRNYNDPGQISEEPMIVRYERAIADDPVFTWDFRYWKPDLVVINLGTNDFSTDPRPSAAIFTQAYIDLLNTIRRHYPLTPILAVAPPIIQEPAAAYIETAVAYMKDTQHDDNVHFFYPQANLVVPNDYGCDYHPNIAGQQKIADQLFPVIQDVMDW